MSKKEIQEALLQSRKLTPSTLNTYTSLLNSVLRSLNGTGIDFFSQNVNDILAFIAKKEKPQSRKTILSALFVLTKDPRYGEQMRKDIKVVNDHYAEKKVSPDREGKTLSIEQVKAITKDICARYLRDKTERNLNDALIALFMSGATIAPRRLEWGFVKIRNFEDTDNYVKDNKVHFNRYKTSRKYGEQIVELPKELIIWLKRIMKFKDRDYLLLNDSGRPYTQPMLSKKLTSMFGCSVDMLRSTYVNDVVYKDEAYQKMEKAAKDMGNSVEAQQGFYVKN